MNNFYRNILTQPTCPFSGTARLQALHRVLRNNARTWRGPSLLVNLRAWTATRKKTCRNAAALRGPGGKAAPYKSFHVSTQRRLLLASVSRNGRRKKPSDTAIRTRASNSRIRWASPSPPRLHPLHRHFLIKPAHVPSVLRW